MKWRQFLSFISPGTLPVSGTGDLCGMNGPASRFAALWLALMGERGKQMRCDERLVAVAQAHAEYLINRKGEELAQSMHIGRGGTTPNQRVRQGGYRLPEFHKDGNTVECCLRGSADPPVALEQLLASDKHRPAMMGEDFWEPSIYFGVGQVGTDWVVLVCPPEEF